jgi:CHAT domain-containing protein
MIFDLVERARARAFLESLGDHPLDLLDPDLRRIQERQRVVSRNIAALSLRIAGAAIPGPAKRALERELEREEEESVRLNSEARRPEDSRIQAWGRSVRPIEDIQRLLLDGNGVLLEYVLGDPCSFLLRISPTDARLYRLPAERALERSLKAYLKSLSDRSQDEHLGLAAAERIGREILPPGSDESFGQAKNLIIVPDGILHDLPYEALRIAAGGDMQYLVEGREVSYAPSASALAILRGRSRPGPWKKQLLAISGPTAKGKPSAAGPVILPPLLFIQKELSSIARAYLPSSVDTLSERAATEARVKAWPLRDYRIIHFACHGLLDGMNPLRSALVLSAGSDGDDDGLLQMREIYGLDLSAEIIVLSACQTGVGRREESEGPLTLARPFFFAGARAVVASLWPISDRSTVPFMGEFYKRLSQGRSASESLREAKLRMLHSRWSHPFYWAGFLLQGDASAAGRSGLVSASRAGH